VGLFGRRSKEEGPNNITRWDGGSLRSDGDIIGHRGSTTHGGSMSRKSILCLVDGESGLLSEGVLGFRSGRGGGGEEGRRGRRGRRGEEGKGKMEGGVKKGGKGGGGKGRGKGGGGNGEGGRKERRRGGERGGGGREGGGARGSEKVGAEPLPRGGNGDEGTVGGWIGGGLGGGTPGYAFARRGNKRGDAWRGGKRCWGWSETSRGSRK